MAPDKESAAEAVSDLIAKTDYCRLVTLAIFAAFAFWLYLDSQRKTSDSEYMREILVRQEVAAKAAEEQARQTGEILQLMNRIMSLLESASRQPQPTAENGSAVKEGGAA
ncbi:MAG: hypothetical protein ABW189_05155 [Rickettsiales bacterium]